MARRNRILGWIRLAGVYVFVAGLVIMSTPTAPLLVAGAVLVLTGETIRLWAAGHLVKSVRLITSGPYAHTQSPLYLGRLLILTGFAIAAHNDVYLNLVALVIGYAIFFFYYMPRKIRVEGGRLTELHGEAYVIYARAVPVLFPSPRRYPGGGTRWSFRQMVRNQEPLVLAGVLAVLAFLTWKLLRS